MYCMLACHPWHLLVGMCFISCGWLTPTPESMPNQTVSTRSKFTVKILPLACRIFLHNFSLLCQFGIPMYSALAYHLWHPMAGICRRPTCFKTVKIRLAPPCLDGHASHLSWLVNPNTRVHANPNCFNTVKTNSHPVAKQPTSGKEHPPPTLSGS